MPPLGRTVFFDVEASSLAASSYPIEIGWAAVDAELETSSKAVIIKPEPGWDDWDQQAERIHGIARPWVEEHGLPAAQIAADLNNLFGTSVLYSDAPQYEAMWVKRLYETVGVRRTWRIGDAIPLLRATAATSSDNVWLSIHLEEPRVHRADADALVLARAFVELRRRRLTPQPERASL